MKAKFKKGQTVYMGRGEHLQELVIEKVHKNPMLPIHQYTFEGKNFACGEQSIRATKDGRDLTIKECLVDDKEAEFRINTLASAKRQIIGEREAGFENEFSIFNSTRVKFRPSFDMCEWFKKYAGDRLIVHVDSGQGHFVQMLKRVKAKVIGIEENINKEWWVKLRSLHDGDRWDMDVNEIVQGDLKKHHNLVEGLKDKVMLVFTRPDDNKNMHYAIQNFMGKCEIILVGLPVDNWESDTWQIIEHKGQSEDDELVYSLK